MKDPEDLATKWHCNKDAITTREVGGKFCTFAAGEAVRVLWDDGLTCCIERLPWDGQLPLCNQLAGVPRLFLKF